MNNEIHESTSQQRWHTMDDRRRFPRLGKKWKMSYSVLKEGNLPQGTLNNYTVNISSGGLCFRADRPLDPDTMVGIELEAGPFPSTILALGQVVWCEPVGPEYEVGVKFCWSGWKKSDQREAIQDYIAFALKDEDV